MSCRIHEFSSLTARSTSKKRKIAETSNVITETLPTVEGEQVSMSTIFTNFKKQTNVRWQKIRIIVIVLQVEIQVIGEGPIEVEESGLEEVVDAAKNAQASSDDSALALLADITSKYQQGEPTIQVIKREEIEEVLLFIFRYLI